MIKRSIRAIEASVGLLVTAIGSDVNDCMQNEGMIYRRAESLWKPYLLLDVPL